MPHRSTRPRVALAALALVAAALGCRPPIAAVGLPPRVEPAVGASVQACWIESRGRLGFTASALLLRHPDGDVLVDAGNSTDFTAEIAVYEPARHRWLATFPGALRPRAPLPELLAAVGVDPGGLRWLLPTHAHLDHLGGAMDLPDVPVLVDPAEAAAIERGRDVVGNVVIPAHARALTPRLARLQYVEQRYEIFDRHADLFGDGSVVVVPLHGHTPGSVAVFVRLPDGRRVVHVGDGVNRRDQIAKLRGRGPGLRRTDTDRSVAEAQVARLHALAAADPGLLWLPAHERDAWHDLFGRPARSCPAL